MGMFDTLLCRRPLPDGLAAADFQTKNLLVELRPAYEAHYDERGLRLQEKVLT